MSSEETEAVAEYLDKLKNIHWFKNIGNNNVNSTECVQIDDWTKWEGPLKESVVEIAYYNQSLFDELMERDDKDTLKSLWDRIQEIVIESASKSVPFDPNEDIWHGPNAAVYAAGWVAGLKGLYIRADQQTPFGLNVQWEWFEKGHWPCDWKGGFPNGKPIVL